ncbi:hypothetical protein J2D78_09800 [Microbacterium maritypicum]|nr:hypothetical protein [Microbacterium liquefaciens]MBP5802375.1 hypothetical protein [Microbacterium liquefaciens]
MSAATSPEPTPVELLQAIDRLEASLVRLHDSLVAGIEANRAEAIA